jgi:hypothetical protein
MIENQSRWVKIRKSPVHYLIEGDEVGVPGERTTRTFRSNRPTSWFRASNEGGRYSFPAVHTPLTRATRRCSMPSSFGS